MKHVLLIFLVLAASYALFVRARLPVYRQVDFWKRRNGGHSKKLLATLVRIDEVFRANKIDYFLIAGSLLGAKRHKTVIYWDDDVDVGVVLNHADEVHRLRTILQRHFRRVTSMYFGLKVDSVCDVFIMLPYENKVQYASKLARKIWPNEWLFQNQVTKLETARMGNRYFPVPARASEYLKRAYGKDHMKYGVITHTHLIRNPLDVLDLITLMAFKPKIELDNTVIIN